MGIKVLLQAPNRLGGHTCIRTYSIRQHTSAYASGRRYGHQSAPAYVSIRQHTSAYVSIRQHTSAYVSIRQCLGMGIKVLLQAPNRYVKSGNVKRMHTST
jgi:hypothetical protein